MDASLLSPGHDYPGPFHYPRKGICITPHLGLPYLYKREARFRFSLLSHPHMNP